MTLKVKIQKQVPGFSLDVEWEVTREIGVIFGYSGAGKSLSLQLIAGLLSPDSGKIQANETVFFDSTAGLNLPPQKRKIGYVFQDSSLFPHMNIADNIRFGFRDQDSANGEKLLLKMAQSFEIEDLLHKFPNEISGGQKQRVAFARALIGAPLALLLDEPFSALDNPIRAKMRYFLKKIQRQFQIPIILVTHDIFEAYSMADKIIIYSAGRVIQTGKPSDVFANPENPLVKNLLDVEEFCRCGIFKSKAKPESILG
ncbi:MAG: ATP-binding cassette domain-containing protein [Candidatus Ozemobacteraceae bacterium]